VNTEQILKLGSKKLLGTVPKPGEKILYTSYNPARSLDPEWGYHVQGLNENLFNSRKRARVMNFDFDLTLVDLAELWIAQRGLCSLTGKELAWEAGTTEQRNPFRASIDRIDNQQGYVKSNIRLVCHWANNARSTYSDEFFYAMCASSTVTNRLTQ